MVAHKIQSGDGGLDLHLKQVPKCLGKLTSEWAPNAFAVSFKLETDTAILRTKADGALAKYGVHLVVANLLQTRKDVCYLVARDASMTTVTRDANALCIEAKLIEHIVTQHQTFLIDQCLALVQNEAESTSGASRAPAALREQLQRAFFQSAAQSAFPLHVRLHLQQLEAQWSELSTPPPAPEEVSWARRLLLWSSLAAFAGLTYWRR